MVDLNADIIKVITDVQAVLIGSPFKIDHFEVGSTGAGGEMIEIDIRRHEIIADDECKHEWQTFCGLETCQENTCNHRGRLCRLCKIDKLDVPSGDSE